MMAGGRRLLCIAVGCAWSVWSTLSARAEAQVAFEDVAVELGLDMVVELPPAGWTGSDPHPFFSLMEDHLGSGVAVADFDRDGDLDVYLLGSLGQPNRLYRNDLNAGPATFTDVTPAPLGDEGFSRAAQFVDLDNDGWMDLVLLNEEDGTGISHSRIFRNEEGTFVDVTDGSGFEVPGFLYGGLGFGDFDGDGLIDIYVSSLSYQMGDIVVWGSAAHLFRNLGNFQFDNVTQQAGVEDQAGENQFAAMFVNLTGRAHPELFVAVDFGIDILYETSDGQTFQNVGPMVGIDHHGSGMGAAIGDFDGDLDLDIFVTKIAHETESGNAFYKNLHSETGILQFEEMAEHLGVEDSYWGWGTEMVDVDNDGDLDLVAVSGFDALVEYVQGDSSPLLDTPEVLWINDGQGGFERRWGTALDVPNDSRALIAFDFDRDGAQDLLITTMDGPVRLLQNRSEDVGNALDVALAPDALALTATVTAVTEHQVMRRDLVAGRSYLTGVPMEVHLGLGEATQVEELRIRWADGVETASGPVQAGQVIEVRRCTTDADCLQGDACVERLCPLRSLREHAPPAVGPSDPSDASVPMADAGTDGGTGDASADAMAPPIGELDAGAGPSSPVATRSGCSVGAAGGGDVPHHGLPMALSMALLVVAGLRRRAQA